MTTNILCKTFPCGVYNTEVLFLAGCSLEDAEILFNKQYDTEVDFPKPATEVLGYTIQTAQGRNVVWFRDRYPGISALVHECSHLAKFILDNRGVDYTNAGESISYYVEYWFRQFYGYLGGKEMPYVRKGKCVYKKDGTKKGCSTSASMAGQYMKALYANEPGAKKKRVVKRKKK